MECMALVDGDYWPPVNNKAPNGKNEHDLELDWNKWGGDDGYDDSDGVGGGFIGKVANKKENKV